MYSSEEVQVKAFREAEGNFYRKPDDVFHHVVVFVSCPAATVLTPFSSSHILSSSAGIAFQALLLLLTS
jgi:hypothetical protein